MALAGGEGGVDGGVGGSGGFLGCGGGKGGMEGGGDGGGVFGDGGVGGGGVFGNVVSIETTSPFTIRFKSFAKSSFEDCNILFLANIELTFVAFDITLNEEACKTRLSRRPFV